MNTNHPSTGNRDRSGTASSSIRAETDVKSAGAGKSASSDEPQTGASVDGATPKADPSRDTARPAGDSKR